MRIAIIGAGIGGLAAAYDLARAGHQVTVYESSPTVGGLAGGFQEQHWEWSLEKYYHHWFATDRHILGLIRELGWEDRVLFPRPYTVMYHNGKFYPFDSILKMALFPGLGWGIDKIRFGLVGLYLRLTNNWGPLEKTTVDAWMRKWAGERVYDKMWQPLIVGKFGPHHKEVNMAWLWARLKSRTTRLGTFLGGFQAFADAFAGRLQEIGVVINLSTSVQRISIDAAGGMAVEIAASRQRYDQCLVTTSPALLARLAPELPQAYLEGLLRLRSMGAVVMILALKHRLSEEGYYWFNIPKAAGFPFLALVEHTNFVSPQHFGGDHLIYCGDYLDPEHEYFRLSQAELLERFLPVLPRFNPKFTPDWVRKTWLFRTAYAQPIPEVNHSRNIPALRTPLPGLYFASMSQVYPWDRGTNFAVEIGRRAAGMMIEESH
ncbi:MAG TPA: NAD(P)/FAD-dependent oxidoreductase [Anaerolineales bacterium]|nr:NAD(P)/FAD-dependent oxidoreductase [Anaerolineales bacterium]